MNSSCWLSVKVREDNWEFRIDFLEIATNMKINTVIIKARSWKLVVDKCSAEQASCNKICLEFISLVNQINSLTPKVSVNNTSKCKAMRFLSY